MISRNNNKLWQKECLFINISQKNFLKFNIHIQDPKVSAKILIY